MLKEFCNTIKDNDTIWVLENSDNSDTLFKKYVTDKLFSSTYVIVSKDIAYVFVHKLDEGNIQNIKDECARVYVYDSYKKLNSQIEEALKELDFPTRLLLSYTTMSDNNTDIISHSSYLRVSKLFRKIYKNNNKKFKIKSSEHNIYEIICRCTSLEIERLKVLAKATDDILKKSFESITVNQSEIEIARNTVLITKEYMEKIKESNKIAKYSMAWDVCPIVLVGEDLEKGGHAEPSSRKIKYGDTVYYDFGIKAEYEDGMVLYTDMQRMGYLLKKDETGAPSEVLKVFNTLKDAIACGINAMNIGVKAYKVDDIVRGKILDSNYPDYPHATGHPVGKEVHGAGALISYKTSKRANLRLVENSIYTLEPRVNIKNGGSIEEMILVTASGAVPLCSTQSELYLIKEKR